MYARFNTKSVRHPGAGRFLIVALALAATLTACRHEAQKPMSFGGEAQGTYYTVSYYDPQQRDLKPMVDSILAAFDQSASLWVDSSLLRRVNAGLTDSLDDILLPLLTHSLDICRLTDGAFDVRVGRVVQAWGFSFRERSEPDSATLADLIRAAHGEVAISGNRIVRQYPDTELDFNAIAQGYSVDILAAAFDSLGIESYLIDVGGEVIAHGSKPGNQPWRVGIERPSADSIAAPQVMTAIALHDASVVTSGSYRKYYERDGIRYSHTIDPSTGRPVQHSLLSVSVVEKECWFADAMATAYMVMGLDKSLEFIQTHQGQPGTAAVMFIYDDHGTLKTYETPEFKKLTI